MTDVSEEPIHTLAVALLKLEGQTEEANALSTVCTGLDAVGISTEDPDNLDEPYWRCPVVFQNIEDFVQVLREEHPSSRVRLASGLLRRELMRFNEGASMKNEVATGEVE